MNSPTPEPAPIYLQLRQRILGFNPDELGLKPSLEAPHVWAVLVEMGYEVGTATLVSLVDGTTSLYYSTGGVVNLHRLLKLPRHSSPRPKTF
jgi:hypothetical protein